MGFFCFARSRLSLRVGDFMDFCGNELFVDHAPTEKEKNPLLRCDFNFFLAVGRPARGADGRSSPDTLKGLNLMLLILMLLNTLTTDALNARMILLMLLILILLTPKA